MKLLIEEASKKCVICGKEIQGYGNNAEPVAKGRCCDECNKTKVIPARLKQTMNEEAPTANKEKLFAEIREIAAADWEVGKIFDPEDFDEFAQIMIEDNPALGYYDEDEGKVVITDDILMQDLWDYYWECWEECRETGSCNESLTEAIEKDYRNIKLLYDNESEIEEYDEEIIDTILENGYFTEEDIESVKFFPDYLEITSKSEGVKKYQFIGDRLYNYDDDEADFDKRWDEQFGMKGKTAKILSTNDFLKMLDDMGDFE